MHSFRRSTIIDLIFAVNESVSFTLRKDRILNLRISVDLKGYVFRVDTPSRRSCRSLAGGKAVVRSWVVGRGEADVRGSPRPVPLSPDSGIEALLLRFLIYGLGRLQVGPVARGQASPLLREVSQASRAARENRRSRPTR